jgi:hypothetical protein
MKKLFLIGAIVIAMLIVTGLQYKAQADEVDGCSACYKKNNGQLRLISSSGKCLKSENYINLCLACSTYQPQNDYFPMGQGDTWTYYDLARQKNETHLISGTETVNGVDATKMIVGEDTYLLFDIYNGTLRIHKIYFLDAIAGCGWSQIVLNPAVIMIPAELSIGVKNTFSTTTKYTNCKGASASQTTTLEVTLEAVEDVTVPAGTFEDCLKYNFKVASIFNPQGQTENTDQTWWMAEGVGNVKTIENGRTEELISATVGGVSYP